MGGGFWFWLKTTKRCSNELLAKWREVPSLITVNIAESVAAEQERQRQDGCAGLEAACSSMSPSASVSGLMELSSSLSLYIHFIQAPHFHSLFFFWSLKNFILLLTKHTPYSVPVNRG